MVSKTAPIVAWLRQAADELDKPTFNGADLESAWYALRQAQKLLSALRKEA